MESSQSADLPRPAISFLTLPPEIRNKIYSHILPITISLSVNSERPLTSPKPPNNSILTSHQAKETPDLNASHPSTSITPNTPSHGPQLLHLAQAHLHRPTLSFPSAIALNYHPPTYRYARTTRLLTNATRPPFRELALTCRTIYNEIAPHIAGSLSINADSLPIACVLAARLGSMAAHVRDVSVRRPFMGGEVNGDYLRDDDGADAISEGVREDSAEQMKAWVRVLAGLLPGVKRLAFAGVERSWMFSEAAMSRALASAGWVDGVEGQDNVDEDEEDVGRWGWGDDQLRVLREVVPAWEEQGRVLVPASAKQVAGMRQVTVVWEVKSSGERQIVSVWQDQRSGLGLEEEWMAYEIWAARNRSRGGMEGERAVIET